MKNFHQNLLILLAISLCALCVWQWYGQTVQRKRIENLDVILTKKSGDIQSYTNSIDTLNHQLEEMDARITELKTAATAQDQTNLAQKREIARLKLTTEILTNQLTQYTNAVTSLEGRLQIYADGVKRQNEAIAKLTTQRDDFIKKLNDSINDRNVIVGKYNDLVKQIDKSTETGNKENK
jgi:chromosome segregation ATPase